MSLVYQSSCTLPRPLDSCRDIYKLLTRTDLMRAHYRDMRKVDVIKRGATETRLSTTIGVQLPLHLGVQEEVVTLSIRLNEKENAVTTMSQGICHVTTDVVLQNDGINVSLCSETRLVNVPFFAKPVAKHVAKSMMERMAVDTEALLKAGCMIG